MQAFLGQPKLTLADGQLGQLLPLLVGLGLLGQLVGRPQLAQLDGQLKLVLGVTGHGQSLRFETLVRRQGEVIHVSTHVINMCTYSCRTIIQTNNRNTN